MTNAYTIVASFLSLLLVISVIFLGLEIQEMFMFSVLIALFLLIGEVRRIADMFRL